MASLKEALGPRVRHWRTDPDYRFHLSLRTSFGVSLAYSLYKALAGLYYRSPWFCTAALYYMVLAAARSSLFVGLRKEEESSPRILRRCRLCAWLLLTTTLMVSAMGLYTLTGGRAPAYPGHMIYGAAAFTFYNLTMALINLIRHRKRWDPVYTTGKILSLSTGLVALFSLQTALLAAFGDGAPWQDGMNIGTGAAVFLLVATMSILLLRRAG